MSHDRSDSRRRFLARSAQIALGSAAAWATLGRLRRRVVGRDGLRLRLGVDLARLGNRFLLRGGPVGLAGGPVQVGIAAGRQRVFDVFGINLNRIFTRLRL